MATDEYTTEDFEILSGFRNTSYDATLKHSTTDVRVRLLNHPDGWRCADYINSQGVWWVISTVMDATEAKDEYRHRLPHRLPVTADAARQLTLLADRLMNYREFPHVPPTPIEASVARARAYVQSPALGGYRSEGYLAAYDW